jgi:biopolymer transport protein ExbD
MAPPKLLIEIRSGGQMFVDGLVADSARITDLVRSRDPSRLAVTIAGSEDASLQQVMTAIDAVRTGGATQIGLAARQTSP